MWGTGPFHVLLAPFTVTAGGRGLNGILVTGCPAAAYRRVT
jgi:hypothetical protein